MNDDEVRLALKRIGNDDDNLLGIYHSHPASQPRPSVIDVAEAHWPRQFYILVSLRNAEPEICAYRIRNGEIEDVQLI